MPASRSGASGRGGTGKGRGGPRRGEGKIKTAKPAGRTGRVVIVRGSDQPGDAGGRLMGLAELAGALGVDPGQLSREAKRAGFPMRLIGSGAGARRGYDLEEVKAWRAHNVRARRADVVTPLAAAAAVVATPVASVPPAAETSNHADLVKVLASGTASALEVARASMQLAARRVASGATDGALGFTDMDDLKKALQELRQAEADYLKLEETKGELIPRDTVKLIVGTCCQRLVMALSVVENSLAGEVAVWLADPAFATLPADERSRKVREFVSATCSEVRRQEAQTLETHLARAQEEEG